MKSKYFDETLPDLGKHPTLDLNNKLAKNYDHLNLTMERWISKKRTIFSKIQGDVLEVGVGTGNNLMYYHPKANIIAFDWSFEMLSQAKMKTRIYELSNIAEFIIGDIQNLSKIFNLNSFDYVVSSCVFCSVPDPILGLKEIYKVLKSSGRLIQIEHGISDNRLINIGLNFFEHITPKIYGFHLNRNHLNNLKCSGFRLIYNYKIDPFGIFRFLVSKKENIYQD
ncbi:MAG: class I SAM-dependent methyltransferase [Promethearchaeota archaeon]